MEMEVEMEMETETVTEGVKRTIRHFERLICV